MPKLLVADDNALSVRFFVEALEPAGHVCACAGDGAEAAALASRERYDLMLIDARMPGLDGCGMLARVRSGSGPSRDAIAIATTADAGDAARRRLLAAGFAEVVVKPIAVDALRDLVARHLEAVDRDGDAIDDRRALSATGGDAAIVAALRGLLVAELDALPAEIAAIVSAHDATALSDRLHRLDASAGFCGAPALTRACARLRAVAANGAPAAADIEAFLGEIASVRAALATRGVAST